VTAFNAERVREDFPILRQSVHGKPLVYLDNAASTQKPKSVVEALSRLYSHDYANIHRGLHALSERTTKLYEDAREKARAFVNAKDAREIVFVRGTTEAINLVASSFGRKFVKSGDEILITAMEHHSNLVPWQFVCEERGATLKVVPIDDRGELDLEAFEKLLSPKTRIVAVTHVSNTLGTINPVKEIVRLAHARGVPVLVDGAQATPHLPIDVQDLDCDFYALSGHKMYGPSGIGILYGKLDRLNALPPYQGGGEMIRVVTFEKSTYADVPARFEAGTPNIAGAIGLGASFDYLRQWKPGEVARYESELLGYATKQVSGIPGVRLIGTAREKGPVLSFVIKGVHAHDVGTILDQEGVAVRAGHLCTQPLMERFGVPALTRASFGLYNTREEVDLLVCGIRKVSEVFA